jgi:hypothetical protein
MALGPAIRAVAAGPLAAHPLLRARLPESALMRDEKKMGDDKPAAACDFDRRSFLKALGATFSVAALPEMLPGCEAVPESLIDVEGLTARQTVIVVRPEDHLILTIGFVNLKRSSAGKLVKVSATLPAFLILDFPSQALAEDAATGGSIPSNFSANAWLGGSSRLIFQLPDAYAPVPYALSEVLGLCATSSVVVADPMKATFASTVTPTSTSASLPPLLEDKLANMGADVDPLASARKMAADGTLDAIQPFQHAYAGSSGKPTGFGDGSVSVIEAPYRLQLSPNALAGWSHAANPVRGPSGAFELWHTVLGARTVGPTLAGSVDVRNAYLRTARALWTRDTDLGGADVAWNPPPPGGRPLLSPSLTPNQRTKIVELSSQAATAVPIQINRLMLSSLGAYMDAHGEWNDASLQSWAHKMTGARENYVQVVSTGVLLPFGNVVTKIHLTKRNDDPSLGAVGALFAFDVYIIRQPTTFYRSGEFAQQATRDTLLRWPFASVELTQTQFVGQAKSGTDYWPVDLSGSPIMVPAVGYDQRGHAIHFELPFYYVGPFQGAFPSPAVDRYRDSLAAPPTSLPRTAGAPNISVFAPAPNNAKRSLNVAMGRQRISYAYSTRDDTTFATSALYIDVTPIAEGKFPYVPVVTGALVDVDAVRSYTDGQPVTVTYHPKYAAGAGLDPAKNASQLLFKIVDAAGNPAPVLVDFRNRPDGGTAFVAPNMRFTALSRTTGPTQDPSAPQQTAKGASGIVATAPKDGAFDPASYLNLVADELDKIRIFGVFRLIDIIKAVDPDEAASDMRGLAKEAEQAALRYAPKFVTEALNELEKILSTISEVKGAIESIWTNTKELLGNDFIESIANAVDGGNPNPVVDEGVAGALMDAIGIGDAERGDAVDKITFLVTRAKLLYKALVAALTHLEHLEIGALAGSASEAGSLPQVLAAGLELKDAIVDLATFAARATFVSKDAVVPADNQISGKASRLLAAPSDAPTLYVSNAVVQVARGLSDGFFAKFKVLEEVIGDVSDLAGLADRLKRLFEQAKQAFNSLTDLTVKIDWQPKIGSYFLPGTDWLVFRPASQHGLSLSLVARTKAKDGKPAGVDVTCRLEQFDLCLGPLDEEQKPDLAIQFDHISFVALAGTKPDVDVKLNGMSFGGPLSFLETLRKIIPLDGFSDPPHLDIDKRGIHAGFSFHVPNIAIGIFSIENISLSAKLEIPFFSDGGSVSMLTFTFAFCDKDHPFLITVSMLGGGGYFVMSVSPHGIESLEASICVGAQIAFSVLDVAQGSLSILVGITFTVTDVTDASGKSLGKDVMLTAFLRLHGELDVLGIVTVSVDLNVSMTYDVTTKVMVAAGTIKIDVSLLLFSVHVDVPFRKEFHACNNDPTLRELMPPNANNISQYWIDYCDAYAAA